MKKQLSIIAALTLCFVLICSTFTVYADEEAPTGGPATISSIEIEAIKVADNESTASALPVGSGRLTLAAKVQLSDGTAATGDQAEVEWALTRDDGEESQSLLTESTSSEGPHAGMPQAELYVPFTEKLGQLTVTATSKVAAETSQTYSVEVFSPKEATSPKTFYNFEKGTISKVTITGEAPTWAETWNKETGKYSTTLPTNQYAAKGYSFAGWKGQDGKTYQPGTNFEIEGKDGYAFTATWKINSVTKTSGLFAKRLNSKAMNLSWQKVKGADGYTVYKWSAKSKKYKAVKDNVRSTAWTQKKLKSNTNHTYRVKAYEKIGSKKVYGPYSEKVSVRTWAKNSKYANVGSFEYNHYSKKFNLGLKAAFETDISVRPETKGKKVVSKAIRYTSSNEKIAKVDSKGNIKAQGKAGSCKITATAHNGKALAIKVSVGDYAHPAGFSNLNKVDKKTAAVLKNYKGDLGDIAAKLETFRGYMDISMEKGKLDIYPKRSLGNVEGKVKNLLSKGGVSDIMLFFGNVYFMTEKGIILYSATEFSQSDLKGSEVVKLAPCWYYADLS